jgi:hypothetical protein
LAGLVASGPGSGSAKSADPHAPASAHGHHKARDKEKKDDSGGGNLLVRNNNAELVAKAEREKREIAKAEAEKKKQLDKLNR